MEINQLYVIKWCSIILFIILYISKYLVDIKIFRCMFITFYIKLNVFFDAQKIFIQQTKILNQVKYSVYYIFWNINHPDCTNAFATGCAIVKGHISCPLFAITLIKVRFCVTLWQQYRLILYYWLLDLEVLTFYARFSFFVVL